MRPPLSDLARRTLADIAQAPVLRQKINPGLANRLESEKLVDIVMLESPFRTVKGLTRYLAITDAGRALLSKK